MLRMPALAAAVVALLAMAPTRAGAQPPGVSAPGAEREQAYVDALRREDPQVAERYVALRDAQNLAIAELDRAQRRYNAGGPEVVLDGRRGHSGRRPLLSQDQEKELQRALEGPAPRGGLWSGPEVARWMSKALVKSVPPQRGWEYMRKAGQTPQIPRPKHGDADPEAQEAFQERTPRARSPGASGAS